MDLEKNSCAISPSPILPNSLPKYCIPVYTDLLKIQQAILKYLYEYPGTCGSNIIRHLEPEFIDLAKRTFNYHIKKLKDWCLIEELTLTKPFPLQLTWAGKQCVQLSSLGVTDRRWVRLEKASVEFDIIELYADRLNKFRDEILLIGKWGKIHKKTFNNWLKVIVKSSLHFFLGGTLEFRFGEYPKFCIYLSSSHGRTAEEAKDRAIEQANYLENNFQDYFNRSQLELTNKDFKWIGSSSTAEYEAPSPVDVEKHVTIKDGLYWFDRSHGYPEMGIRTIQQAEKQFAVPYQLDTINRILAELIQEISKSSLKNLQEISKLSLEFSSLESKINAAPAEKPILYSREKDNSFTSSFELDHPVNSSNINKFSIIEKDPQQESILLSLITLAIERDDKKIPLDDFYLQAKQVYGIEKDIIDGYLRSWEKEGLIIFCPIMNTGIQYIKFKG